LRTLLSTKAILIIVMVCFSMASFANNLWAQSSKGKILFDEAHLP